MESSVVVKLFGLLETLAGSRGGDVSLGTLAQSVGIAKPTVHRLLKIMCDLGYVERADGGMYRLTRKLLRLANGDDEDGRLTAAAERPLEALHRRTGETVNLGVLQRERIVYLRVIESPQALRRVVDPQSTDPFYCTALGRAIAGHLPSRQQDYLLRTSRLERRTPVTVVDPDAIRALLASARSTGHAIEHDQTDVGVTCVASPVIVNGSVLAAVSVSVPTARCDSKRTKELVAAVRETADAIVRALSREPRHERPAGTVSKKAKRVLA